MGDIQYDIWENSKHGEGGCQGCPKEEGEYNHPGFFNYNADVLVVEEAPSKKHFKYDNYDRGCDYEWYQQFYEEEHLSDVLSWPPITVFLERVFRPNPPGLTRTDIVDELYMTSCVKCPVGSDAFEKALDFCSTYLEREINEMDPEVIITAGAPATKRTAQILGVSRSYIRDIYISKPEWWGLSKFDSDPPMIHVPHWGYYNTHNRLTDNEWDSCIEAVREGLLETVYQKE